VSPSSQPLVERLYEAYYKVGGGGVRQGRGVGGRALQEAQLRVCSARGGAPYDACIKLHVLRGRGPGLCVTRLTVVSYPPVYSFAVCPSRHVPCLGIRHAPTHVHAHRLSTSCLPPSIPSHPPQLQAKLGAARERLEGGVDPASGRRLYHPVTGRGPSNRSPKASSLEAGLALYEKVGGRAGGRGWGRLARGGAVLGGWVCP
jgi:hypothetical protein